jgi:Glycosyl hydrolase family 99
MLTVWLVTAVLLAAAHPSAAAMRSVRMSVSSIPASTRPVLAFYYTWYHPSTFCSCQMSDLPPVRYESSDDVTINRQISQAAHAGITGFITSWPGPGNTQNVNLGKLLADAAAYQRKTGTHFVSSIYFESDAVAIRHNLVGAMRYAIKHYVNDPHFFRWHGKPVIFFWDPLGNGRTLKTWADVRRRVDPNHRLIWSAEGTDTSVLSVFDGLHIFTAADWGLLDGTIDSVDRSFRARIDAFNAVHHTHRIWAAGVEPGFDDTRVPGRPHPHVVPRNHGATYRKSWLAAMSSNPSWITITSFNEWFEGAMIEPSVRYGSLYLKLTAKYSTQWRRMR